MSAWLLWILLYRLFVFLVIGVKPTGHLRLAAAARRLVPAAVPVVTHAIGPLSLLLTERSRVRDDRDVI